jgi:carboxylesterase
METIKLLKGATPFFYPGNKIGCLVIHGLTGTPYEVRWLGQFLNQQGYTVYGPRLAGHGTTPQDLAKTTWREWYYDVLSGYEMLREQCEQVFVMGLSMGGVLSLVLAGREAVDGVIAMATPHQIEACQGWRSFLLPTAGFFKSTISKQLSSEVFELFEERVKTEQRNRGEEPIGHPTYPVWVTRAINQLCAMLKVMRAGLPHITAPVLLIYSSADETVSLENLQLNYEAMGRAKKYKLVLQESLHVVTEDIERESVFKAVDDFIKKCTQKDQP